MKIKFKDILSLTIGVFGSTYFITKTAETVKKVLAKDEAVEVKPEVEEKTEEAAE